MLAETLIQPPIENDEPSAVADPLATVDIEQLERRLEELKQKRLSSTPEAMIEQRRNERMTPDPQYRNRYEANRLEVQVPQLIEDLQAILEVAESGKAPRLAIHQAMGMIARIRRQLRGAMHEIDSVRWPL